MGKLGFQSREAQKQNRLDKEKAKVEAEKAAREAKEAADEAKKEKEAEEKAAILSGNPETRELICLNRPKFFLPLIFS